MQKLIIIAVLLLSAVGFGADIYVNGDSGTDDTVANGYGYPTGTSNGPMATIVYALTQAADGDTIKLEDATYDDSTQGAGWKINPIDDEDYTIEPVSGTETLTLTTSAHGIYISNNNTLTIKNCTIVLPSDNDAGRMFYRLANKTGTIVLDTCTYTNTGDGQRYTVEFAAGTQGGGITLIDSTVTFFSLRATIRTGSIDLFKMDGSTFIADNAGVYGEGGQFFDLTGNVGEIQIINGSTIDNDINAAADTGRLVDFQTSSFSLGLLKVWDSKVSMHDECIQIYQSNVRKIDLYNADFDSEMGNTVWIGHVDLDGSGESIDVRIWNSTIDTPAGGALTIRSGADGADIGYNTISGTDHSFSIKANNCNIHNNTVSGPLSCAVFGNGNNIHNNIFASSGTALLLGGPNGSDYNGWMNATGNKVVQNIITTTSGSHYCINDYEGGVGDQSSPRGLTLTLDETETATAIAAAVVTGTGSAWTTDGVKLVHAGDIFRITAGTGPVAGDYIIKSVDSATQLTLYESPGNYAGAGVGDLAYTIIRNDFMRDFVDKNIYWNSGDTAKVYSIGLTPTTGGTLAGLQAAWIGTKATTQNSGVWNDTYGTVNDQNSKVQNPGSGTSFVFGGIVYGLENTSSGKSNASRAGHR